MEIGNDKDWKELKTKIRHQFSNYTDEEMFERKGGSRDLIANLKKIWSKKEPPPPLV